MRTKSRTTSVAVISLLMSGFAFAQNPPGQDPPSRVARLNMINGPVSFQPASVDDWTNATLNYPMTTGDHLYADIGARAEMHVGPNAIRLWLICGLGGPDAVWPAASVPVAPIAGVRAALRDAS